MEDYPRITLADCVDSAGVTGRLLKEVKCQIHEELEGLIRSSLNDVIIRQAQGKGGFPSPPFDVDDINPNDFKIPQFTPAFKKRLRDTAHEMDRQLSDLWGFANSAKREDLFLDGKEEAATDDDEEEAPPTAKRKLDSFIKPSDLESLSTVESKTDRFSYKI